MGPQISRAQLLLALHQRQVSALALEHTAEAWWGYEAQYEPEASGPEHTVTLAFPQQVDVKVPNQSKQGLPAPRNPLQMPEAWVAWWIGSEQGDTNKLGDTKLEALTAEELHPPDEPQVSYQDLVPLPRLLPALQKQVRAQSVGGLDVKRLLSASAKRQWPARLPRTKRASWPQNLVLLLDCRVGLFPYRHDFFRLATALEAQVPASQLSVYAGEDGPDGPWEPWSTEQATERKVSEGLPKSPGATYLVLSDLGLLCPTPGLQQHWLKCLKSVGHAGNALFALAPVEAHQVSKAMAELVQVLRWSPNSRCQPERGGQEMAGQGDLDSDEALALGQLLACVGAVLRMDPPLLRAMRQASHWPNHVGLEGQVWAHAQVSGTSYASLKPSSEQGPGRPLPPAMADVLSKASSAHHAHWSLGMRVVDNMRLLSSNPAGDDAMLANTRHAIVQLARASQPVGALTTVARHTASYVLNRVPVLAKPMLADVLNVLAESLGDTQIARVPWSLVQVGLNLVVLPQSSDRKGPGVVLATHLGYAAPGDAMLLWRAGHAPLVIQIRDGVTLPTSLPSGSQLIFGGERTVLKAMQRTRGVVDWGQTNQGLLAHVSLPWSDGYRPFAPSFVEGQGAERLIEGPFSAFVSQIGRRSGDVYLGVRFQAMLLPKMDPPEITCFRYLPPATFLMGSPEGKGDGDEHPQHPVTLTQALWLAETPCTQALWQAVMGQNPSHFNTGPEAPQRPVECVSWDDVQQFLAKLNALLPEGCEAVLPTEAQWEYACRAGTATAYWWGDEPDDSKANFYSPGDKKADAEKGTTPVDRYAPNPWGLRDMHGNVWEWCADGKQRTYEQRTIRDPMGDTGGDARVVRGGSWDFHPGLARSAHRGGRHRGFRALSRGFRFALRSSSPQGAEPQPGGLKADQTAKKGGEAGGRSAGTGASGKATRAGTKKKGPA